MLIIMKYLPLTIFFSILISFQAESKINVSKLIGDHMVIQRNHKVPVWGWAEEGEKIVVTFQKKIYRATPDASGKWMVHLSPMEAGGPFEMSISGLENAISVKDILIGDVWLCSGQSNMEWPVNQSNNFEEEMANATDDEIRHFKIPLSSSNQPEQRLEGGEWVACSSETVGTFTAVGYFFARELRKKHNVPIGLINSSWGGSRIEPWMSAEKLGFQNIEDAAEGMLSVLKDKEKKLKADLEKQFGKLPTKDRGMHGTKAIWASPYNDDSEWKTMNLPGLWEDQGLKNFDGVVWFTKTIELTEEEATQPASISLAKIDDSDITWVNGDEIGASEQAWNEIRHYEIPPDILVEGENKIAVRVDDTGGGGGFHGDADLMFLEIGDQKKSLSGVWKYEIGKVNLASSFQHNQIPTYLYNKMIHPIIGYPIKGVIWYQGESNVGDVDSKNYAELFPAMIQDWRERWNIGDFPFLWVQLANFLSQQDKPVSSNWAVLRESQHQTLHVSNTAEAVIIDIGDADDIHPRNKQDVGYRLSLAARKLAYGEALVYSGPVYKSMKIEGDQVRVSFDHIGSGLKSADKYGYVRGFAIAGSEKKFVWAQARIEGNEVVVKSSLVPEPKYIRYAWADNPGDANLYNQEGLPACPFRSE